MQTKNINQQQQRITNTNSDIQYEHVRHILDVVSSQDVSINRPPEVEGDVNKRFPNCSSSKSTPPAYRMPPHPLYNEHAAAINNNADNVILSSNQQIHTHSSKFPIEREVTLSNCDKNSKMSILNDYRRKNQKAGGPSDYTSNNSSTWTDDNRTNRTYSEIRNIHQFPVTPDGHTENQRVYKSQLPILETTNGSEPSPIANQDDSNGFANYSKITSGRSQSTPETEFKPFPSRTYHTIRDMISSRFNKNKSEQTNTYTAAAALNNGDNNETGSVHQNGNLNESLSPNSQLMQRGVYLANHPATQQNVHHPVRSSQQLAARNYGVYRNPPQEIKNTSYRERAVDVGTTVGISQQVTSGNTNSTTIVAAPSSSSSSQFRSEDPIAGRRDIAGSTGNIDVALYQDVATGAINRNMYRERLSKVPAGSRQPVFESSDTPNRYGSSNAIDRHSGRGYQINRSNIPSSGTTVGTPIKVGNRLQANGKVQSCSKLNELTYQHVSDTIANDYNKHSQNKMSSVTRVEQQPLAHYGSSSQLHDVVRTKVNGSQEVDRRLDSQQISSDTKYDNGTMERCNIPRTKSSDHLLSEETTLIHEPNNRREFRTGEDSQLLMKSKSFENLSALTDLKKELVPQHENGCTDSTDPRLTEVVGGHSDSGRGSTIYSSTGGDKFRRNGTAIATTDGSSSSQDSSEPHASTIAATITAASTAPTNLAGKDNPWVDIVETELKHILEPKTAASIANSTLSDDETSTSPPLQAASPDVSSDEFGTRAYKHKSALYSTRPEQFSSYRNTTSSTSHNRGSTALWNNRTSSKDKSSSSHQHHRLAVTTKTPENRTCRLPSTIASSSVDLESMLDEENNSSEENISTADTRAMRKQLEGLENMYSEILKLLGVRKSTNGLFSGRHMNSDARIHKRRLHGSVSSLPSSVSSRPLRDRYKKYHYEEKKKPKKDAKNINKRFQTLESHVITLARSVAHLSSEMRTQHLMFQEISAIQNELASLRAQTNLISKKSSNSLSRTTRLSNSEQVNSSPDKVKKLTKFFGDEPPLLRLFLRKLGYEKYAVLFEKERIGLVELPYMSEERLHKLGVPMGPRLRILQEAQLGFPGANENTLCIV